jgi:hypothetical protein
LSEFTIVSAVVGIDEELEGEDVALSRSFVVGHA